MATDIRLKEQLPELTDRIVDTYREIETINHLGHCPLPSAEVVVEIAEDLKEIIYPGYRKRQNLHLGNVTYHIGDLIDSLHDRLTQQIARALRHDFRRKNHLTCTDISMDFEARGQEIAVEFLSTIPEIRRVSDRVTTQDLGPRLAALPVRERAVLAFFAGDFTTVVNLLSNAPRPDAESLFLLAFSHDFVGLNQPGKYEAYLDALVTGFPENPLTLATAGLRQSRIAELKRTPEEPSHPTPKPPLTTSGAAPANPTAAPPAAVAPNNAAAVMARRDLNRDGKISLIEFRIWRGPNADLKSYDRNGDGFLDVEELEAVVRE